MLLEGVVSSLCSLLWLNIFWLGYVRAWPLSVAVYTLEPSNTSTPHSTAVKILPIVYIRAMNLQSQSHKIYSKYSGYIELKL